MWEVSVPARRPGDKLSWHPSTLAVIAGSKIDAKLGLLKFSLDSDQRGTCPEFFVESGPPPILAARRLSLINLTTVRVITLTYVEHIDRHQKYNLAHESVPPIIHGRNSQTLFKMDNIDSSYSTSFLKCVSASNHHHREGDLQHGSLYNWFPGGPQDSLRQYLDISGREILRRATGSHVTLALDAFRNYREIQQRNREWASFEDRTDAAANYFVKPFSVAVFNCKLPSLRPGGSQFSGIKLLIKIDELCRYQLIGW